MLRYIGSDNGRVIVRYNNEIPFYRDNGSYVRYDDYNVLDVEINKDIREYFTEYEKRLYDRYIPLRKLDERVVMNE